MDATEFVKQASMTDTDEAGYKRAHDRLGEPDMMQLLHMAMGLATEAAEFLDMIKKHVMYGKVLDLVNLKEEVSDCLWYSAGACRILKVPMEQIMDMNIAKLRARYPDKFTEDSANSRDLTKERAVLEDGASAK